MSGKTRQFPLSLASLGNKASRTVQAKTVAVQKTATPQTATQNAAQYGARALPQSPSRIIPVVRPVHGSSDSDRAMPMVSEAVRKAMVARIAKQGVKDTKVLAAMEAIPRHFFLEPALASQAYIDASLPIGHHQTISQPYIVARMIEVMRHNKQGGVLNNVLEIGTGCGYQAAVLSLLAKEVYSIERIKPLH